jgi:hypothetical protein
MVLSLSFSRSLSLVAAPTLLAFRLKGEEEGEESVEVMACNLRIGLDFFEASSLDRECPVRLL